VEETLNRAADYERKADYDRALECYRYVLDIDESRRDVREKLVDTAIVAGLNDDLIEQCLAIVDDNLREEAFGSAARILEKLRQAAPGQAEIMHKQIEVLRREGRETAAAKLQLDLARQLLDKGRTDEAAEQLRSIDSIDSLPSDFLHQLAAAQRDSGLNIQAAETYGRLAEKLVGEQKVDEAADVFETVIGLNPADTGIRRRQIDLYLQAKQAEKAVEKYAGLVEQLIAQQNWDEAENAARKALGEAPDDPRLLEFRAQIHKARGRPDAAREDLLAIARKRSESEDWSATARVLQQLLIDDPENAEAALLLGEAAMKWQRPRIAEEPLQHIASHFLGQKDYDQAESILKKLRELAPRDATVLVQLSTVYRNLDQDTQLLEIYQELVTTFMENESYAKALEYCTAILDHDAENIWALEQMIRICERTEKKASIPELCLRLADIYEKLDDSDHAQELFERAIETDPGNAKARVEYMHFLVGLHRYEAASQQARCVVEQMANDRRFAEAIQLIEDLLQHTPDDIALRRALIDICRRAGMEREFITHCTQLINLYYRRNEFPEVVDLYRELLEHEPENITFRTHLIDALLRLKRRDEAIDQYFELAKYYMRKENHEDAQSTLVELLDQSPGNPRALEMLVEILIETGQHDRAVQRIRELSEIYVGIGKNERAVEILRRVLAFDPDNREIRRRIGEISREDEQLRASVDDLLARATSEWNGGNVTGAIEAQREAARLRPDDTSLRHRLSEMLSHQGSTLAALNELVQVARIRSEQGDYESSMEAVEQILNREPNHPVARRMKAELFAKMGDQQKALEEFMKITPTATPVPEDSLPRAAGSPAPATETLQVVPDFNFDNFVVGEHNRFAHATAMAIAKAPAVHYNPLFLYSDVGLGKTHLISAIANYVAKNMQDLRVIYTNAEEFTGQLVEAIQHTTVNAFRSRYKAADVLLVDDIHFLAGKERAQEEFFHIFNTLFQSKRQIVVTSDRPPKDIARLEKRLKSRFGSGVIVDIQAPDVETRIAILRKELEKRDGVEIDKRLLALIAETIESNVRELKAALNQVVLRNQVSQAAITEDLVREVLEMYSEEK
jgi:chromosomal replication initiator protein DnaA